MTHTYNPSTGEKLGQEDSNESEGSLDYTESISKTNKKVHERSGFHTYGAGSSEVQLQQRTVTRYRPPSALQTSVLTATTSTETTKGSKKPSIPRDLLNRGSH